MKNIDANSKKPFLITMFWNRRKININISSQVMKKLQGRYFCKGIKIIHCIIRLNSVEICTETIASRPTVRACTG